MGMIIVATVGIILAIILVDILRTKHRENRRRFYITEKHEKTAQKQKEQRKK